MNRGLNAFFISIYAGGGDEYNLRMWDDFDVNLNIDPYYFMLDGKVRFQHIQEKYIFNSNMMIL